jgi:hypothetical protein
MHTLAWTHKTRESCPGAASIPPGPIMGIDEDAFMDVLTVGPAADPETRVKQSLVKVVPQCQKNVASQSPREQWHFSELGQNEHTQCPQGLLKTIPAKEMPSPQNHDRPPPYPSIHTAPSCTFSSCPGGVLFAKSDRWVLPKRRQHTPPCPLHVPSHRASLLPGPTQSGPKSW